MKIHNVQPVSRLVKYHEPSMLRRGERIAVPSPPTFYEDGDDIYYDLERIVGQKLIRKVRHFLVKWKGYSSRHNTWEPEEHLRQEGMGSEIDEFLDSSLAGRTAGRKRVP